MKIRLDYVTPDYSSSPGETETLGYYELGSEDLRDAVENKLTEKYLVVQEELDNFINKPDKNYLSNGIHYGWLFKVTKEEATRELTEEYEAQLKNIDLYFE